MDVTRETWQFINSFGPWLSALGTIAAVITALYLAKRADKIRLQLRVGIRKVAIQGEGGDHGRDYVWVSITNLGRRKANITHLFWKPVPWRKRGIIWIAPQNQYSLKFPVTIEDGESANYVLPVEEFRERFRIHAREIFSSFADEVWLRTLRFCVSTSTGETFYQTPEAELRGLFRDIANEKVTNRQGNLKKMGEALKEQSELDEAVKDRLNPSGEKKK